MISVKRTAKGRALTANGDAASLMVETAYALAGIADKIGKSDKENENGTGASLYSIIMTAMDLLVEEFGHDDDFSQILMEILVKRGYIELEEEDEEVSEEPILYMDKEHFSEFLREEGGLF